MGDDGRPPGHPLAERPPAQVSGLTAPRRGPPQVEEEPEEEPEEAAEDGEQEQDAEQDEEEEDADAGAEDDEQEAAKVAGVRRSHHGLGFLCSVDPVSPSLGDSPQATLRAVSVPRPREQRLPCTPSFSPQGDPRTGPADLT